MKSRLLWFFVALACSTGCAVDPPTPLERDPEHVALAEGSPLGLRIAIAPIQLPQRDAAGVAALGSAAAPHCCICGYKSARAAARPRALELQTNEEGSLVR